MPLEEAILDVTLRRHREGAGSVHGFALAKELAASAGGSDLVGHGTLYKALGRLERAGLLESSWEDPEAAASEGRPRRRLYSVTAAGAAAVAATVAALDPVPRARTARA